MDNVLTHKERTALIERLRTDRSPGADKLRTLLEMGFEPATLKTILGEASAESALMERTQGQLAMKTTYKQAGSMRFKAGADEFESTCAALMAGLDTLHDADPAAATDLAKRLVAMVPAGQQSKTARSGDLFAWFERGIRTGGEF